MLCNEGQIDESVVKGPYKGVRDRFNTGLHGGGHYLVEDPSSFENEFRETATSRIPQILRDLISRSSPGTFENTELVMGGRWFYSDRPRSSFSMEGYAGYEDARDGKPGLQQLRQIEQMEVE